MIVHKFRHQDEQGFTIVELMIATAVLSLILLLASVMMINIGNLFDKGINQSRTQDATRSITDNIAQNLKYDGGSLTTPSPPVNFFCIGNTRYSFVTGVELGTGKEADGVTQKSLHVLWRDAVPVTGCTAPANLAAATPSPGGTELIPPNSRLTAFCVGTLNAAGTTCQWSGSTPFNVVVEVAYGDGDLLSGTTGSSVTCKGGVGEQFCATASLTTTVVQRLP